MAPEENLKAVERAIGNISSSPKPFDIADVLDRATKALEEGLSQIEEVRRRLSLIQKSIGGANPS